MNIEKVKKFILENSYPSYRINQIEKAIYKNHISDFMDIKEIPIDLREKLTKNFKVLSFSCIQILRSNFYNAYKASLKLKDDFNIETALLAKSSAGWTVCVSTQVGCAIRCPFCISGRNGLKRNLNYEEISDQVLFWEFFLKKENIGEIKSVVYMGMGEPFLNYENTIKSIKIINEKIGIGKRNISVSSFGHPDFIRRFAKEMPQVNLAISLHSASDEKRNKLVPLNMRYSLSLISKALKDYINITKRKVFIEYVMLKDINDKTSDARKLLEWIKQTHFKKYFTVNLIPYNATSENFKPSDPQRIKAFQNFLITANIETTIRKSLGSDINGACGQLALSK